MSRYAPNARMNMNRPPSMVFFLPNFLPSQPAGRAAIAEAAANAVVMMVASAVVLPSISAAKRAKKVEIALVPQKRKNRPRSMKIRLLLSAEESFSAFLAAFSALRASFSAFLLAASSAA